MAGGLANFIIDHINRGTAADIAGQAQQGQLSPADAAASYTAQTGLSAGDLFGGVQQSALAKLASDPTFASMAPQDQLSALAKLGDIGVIPKIQEMAVNRAYGQALGAGTPSAIAAPQNGSTGDTQPNAPAPQALPGQASAATGGSPLASFANLLGQGLNPASLMGMVKNQADLNKTAADTAVAQANLPKIAAETAKAGSDIQKTNFDMGINPGASAASPTGSEPSPSSSVLNPLTLYSRIQAAENEPGDPQAVGDGGKATGLMQTHPAAFTEGAEYAGLKNANPKNPAHQMLAGQGYFQKQLDTFHDPVKATIAYNAGPSVAANWDGNVQSLPPQTQSYLGKVFGSDIPTAGAPQGSAVPATPGLGGKAAQEVAQKSAEEKAKETLAAEKGVQQILSRMPSMKQKLSRMRELAPNTLAGVGVVPNPESNESFGWKGQLANQANDPRAANTFDFKNLNDQLFVNEIPALMNGASGMRMDIPLVKGVKSASGVPLEANAQGKQQVIDSLNQNFDQTRDNALSYYKNLTGHDYDLGKAFNSPQQVVQAIKSGVITKEQGAAVLKQHHGFQ
jgi:hypothetical protein